MASIKMGLAVADIRGSIAGTTFSHGTYGMYVRRKARPVNTNRNSQTARRAAFAALASAWRGLSDDQRKTWVFQAPNYTRANAFGDNVPLTGQSLYMRASGMISLIGLGSLFEAIPPQGVATVPVENLEVDQTGGTISFDLPLALPANTAAVIYVTDAMNEGRLFVSKDKYRIAGVYPAATSAGTITIESDIQRLFGRTVSGFTATTPMYLFARFVNINTGEYFDSEVLKSKYTP